MSPASERSPGSRGESKGEATRARIIQRALELATRVGLEGLSIGDLAQDLGLSKSGLFAHFGSKEQLQLDVLDAAAELFRAVVFDPVRGAVGQARLVALFENMLKWVQARDLPGGCIFMAGAFEWDDAQGPVRQRMVEWFEKLNGVASRARWRRAVEQGEFRADLDAELFAYELHSISAQVPSGGAPLAQQESARVRPPRVSTPAGRRAGLKPSALGGAQQTLREAATPDRGSVCQTLVRTQEKARPFVPTDARPPGAHWLLRRCPRLGALLVAELAMAPRTRLAAIESRPGDTQTELRVGKRRLRVHAFGEGPLVVLVHGWQGAGSQMRASPRPSSPRAFGWPSSTCRRTAKPPAGRRAVPSSLASYGAWPRSSDPCTRSSVTAWGARQRSRARQRGCRWPAWSRSRPSPRSSLPCAVTCARSACRRSRRSSLARRLEARTHTKRDELDLANLELPVPALLVHDLLDRTHPVATQPAAEGRLAARTSDRDVRLRPPPRPRGGSGGAGDRCIPRHVAGWRSSGPCRGARCPGNRGQNAALRLIAG